MKSYKITGKLLCHVCPQPKDSREREGRCCLWDVDRVSPQRHKPVAEGICPLSQQMVWCSWGVMGFWPFVDLHSDHLALRRALKINISVLPTSGENHLDSARRTGTSKSPYLHTILCNRMFECFCQLGSSVYLIRPYTVVTKICLEALKKRLSKT